MGMASLHERVRRRGYYRGLRLVIDRNNQYSQRDLSINLAGQSDRELGELTGNRINLDGATVLLNDDVMAHRKPEARPFTGRLRGEERIEHLLFHFGRNASP